MRVADDNINIGGLFPSHPCPSIMPDGHCPVAKTGLFVLDCLAGIENRLHFVHLQNTCRSVILINMEKRNYINKNIYDISYTMHQARIRLIRNIVLGTFLFFVSLNLLLVFCISPIKQNSRSMEPNILHNSYSLTTPFGLFSGSKLRRGEIVMIERESNKKATGLKNVLDTICRTLTFQKAHPFTEDNYFLSRIAALPGDTIYMKDFVLYITPRYDHFSYTEFELNQVPYSIDIRIPPAGWNTQIGVRGNFDKIELGENEYFVLADNRLSSMDSRTFGVLKKNQIKRKVLMTYFPFKAFRLFRSKVNK